MDLVNAKCDENRGRDPNQTQPCSWGGQPRGVCDPGMEAFGLMKAFTGLTEASYRVQIDARDLDVCTELPFYTMVGLNAAPFGPVPYCPDWTDNFPRNSASAKGG